MDVKLVGDLYTCQGSVLVLCPRELFHYSVLVLWGYSNKHTNAWVSLCRPANLTLSLPAPFLAVIINLCHNAGHLGI